MIRTQIEINTLINKGQHALANLGIEIAQLVSGGVDEHDEDLRDKQYRVILLNIYLDALLTPTGSIKAYWLADQKRYNKILDGLQSLSGFYTGPAIPLLGKKNLPLVYYPSTSTGGGGGGQQPVTPGGTTFQNLQVDAPGEVVDQFDANISSFAYYIYSVQGQNVGEGNRSGFFIISWKGTTVNISGDPGTPETGGDTNGVSFSAAIVSGKVQLTCNVPSNNWIVRGVRILFQSSSFLSQAGEFPNGFRTDSNGPFFGVQRFALPSWNMDTVSDIDILIDPGTRAIILGAEIIDDSGTTYFNLDAWNSGAEVNDGGWRYTQSLGVINLRRRTGGVFDQSTYSSTSSSRGTVTVLFTF